jgi:hypothetical protein
MINEILNGVIGLLAFGYAIYMIRAMISDDKGNPDSRL